MKVTSAFYFWYGHPLNLKAPTTKTMMTLNEKVSLNSWKDEPVMFVVCQRCDRKLPNTQETIFLISGFITDKVATTGTISVPDLTASLRAKMWPRFLKEHKHDPYMHEPKKAKKHDCFLRPAVQNIIYQYATRHTSKPSYKFWISLLQGNLLTHTNRNQ